MSEMAIFQQLAQQCPYAALTSHTTRLDTGRRVEWSSTGEGCSTKRSATRKGFRALSLLDMFSGQAQRSQSMSAMAIFRQLPF
jgi:hypothetical protein